MAATKKTEASDDGNVVQVKDADGRVHFTAKGSATERDLTAKANKGKDSGDAAPAVAAG